MGSGIQLFTIKNIPIRLHPSWFLIFALLTWSLANGYFAPQAAGLPGGSAWFMALVTSLFFFASVLAHELGHAFVALRERVPVKSISLFFFGGVAQIGREPETPGAEFRIAIAGPLVSVALAGAFQVVVSIFSGLQVAGAALFLEPAAYLARINLILALFNLIPGFPLDGGRIFRAIVWKLNGNLYRATQIASWAGQLVAFGFIAYGVFSFFNGAIGNGLWMGFIGWFLLNAAGAARAQVQAQEKLEGVAVDQVMSRSYPVASSDISLEELVRITLSSDSPGAFLVERRWGAPGIVTMREISTVPRHLWSRVTAEQVMRPFQESHPVTPDTPLLAALQQMEEGGLAHLPVMVGNQIRGFLSREQILRYLRLRTEFGI
jgi:Zn-dependent protease/predicted transcriptional regulator